MASSPQLSPSPLPPSHGVHANLPPPPPMAEVAHNPNSIVITLGTTIEEAEKSLILRTLEFVGGNKQKAARVLGISRRCLYNRLEEYGVMKSSAEAHAAAGHDDNGDAEAEA